MGPKGKTREPRHTLYGSFPPGFPRPPRQPRRQALAQLRQSLPHAFLHCLDGDFKRAGNLNISESVLAAQSKDFTAVVGQAIYGVALSPLQLHTEDLFFGGWRSRGVDCPGCSFGVPELVVPDAIERP